MLAATLPGGHLFQVKIDGVTGYAELTAPDGAIPTAVQQFENPDVGASKVANNAALGRKPKAPKTPAPKDTTVTVLNGNGVAGSAASASYQLAQRGYITLLPPGQRGAERADPELLPLADLLRPDAEEREGGGARAREARRARRREADAEGRRRCARSIPARCCSSSRARRSTTRSGTVRRRPRRPEAASRRTSPTTPAPGTELVEQYRGQVPFKLMVPTVLERSSQPDPAYGDTPARLYKIDRDHKAIRLVFRTGASEYWGVAGDRLEGRARARRPQLPAPARRAATTTSTTRASTCTWWCCRQGDATYWVVNTLLDSLSNETMLAIAKGLKPLGAGQVESRPMARIGIFGAGWVGLVTGACFAELGHDVVIRDVVADKIEALQRGEVPFHEDEVPALLERNRDRLTFTLDAGRRGGLRVPLRLRRHAADALRRRRPLARVDGDRGAAAARRAHRSLVMKSTVPVGTGEKVRIGLDARGLEHVGYASNPEFLAEGHAVDDFMHPDRVVVGAFEPDDADAVAALYDGARHARSCAATSTRPR